MEDALDTCQPRGKQRWLADNFGCWYVQTTGIWKTVWLETAASSYLKSAKITPNVQAAAVEIEFEVEAKNCEDCVLEICASFGGTVVSCLLCTSHADEVQQGERIAVEYADASAGYRHRSGLLQCDKFYPPL